MLTLIFNSLDQTLDLHGPLRGASTRRIKKVFTYNPARKVYQSSVTREAAEIAVRAGASVDPEDQHQIVRFLQAASQGVSHDSGASHETSETASMPAPLATVSERVGCVVRHPSLGLGRLLTDEGRVATVEFFFPPSQHRLTCNVFERALIPVGTPCQVSSGRCIIKTQSPGQDDAPHLYGVEFEDGLVERLPETELTPTQLTRTDSPLELLATCQQDGYPVFRVREQLVLAYGDLVRRGAGVKSLLSSRIDLHPHQAYVAGTVILDSKQRYLLADEVGLGKTIEAGIVIHDLLSWNPKARVLILCPGALLQQWFSEMYSKFSGIVFRLPEISGVAALSDEQAPKAILSLRGALALRDTLAKVQWDLIVLDEVHHLLRVPCLYQLVKDLSLLNSGLLLLSALPAQHREQEYYDLLALLEPHRYEHDRVSREKFALLFERQREIGGRVGVVKRRLLDVQEEGPEQAERVIRQFQALLELPVLQEDQQLEGVVRRLDAGSSSFVSDAEAIIHYICDYYRINRRILRNRREKLIASDQLQKVRREHTVLMYDPDQYELDALAATTSLLRSLHASGVRDQVLLPLTEQLFQAGTAPETLLCALKIGECASPRETRDSEQEELRHLASYSDWAERLTYFWSVALEALDQQLLRDAINATQSWGKQGDGSNPRQRRLIRMLEGKRRTQPNDKFILFAGFPGLASILAERLCERFGSKAIARFHHGLDADLERERDLKETEVRRFRIDSQTWLLVCDETGGEGRNFQFAAELIHYDLPLQASKIEQRIGRLDRLGRKRPDVISNLIVCRGSSDEAWFRCLSEGLGVFGQSISGLEFGLRDIEREVSLCLLSDDDGAMWNLPAALKRRVAEERALDESQAQMDEASYDRARAVAFRRVQSSEEQDQELESTFAEYVKMVTAKGGVRFLQQTDFPEGVIQFEPEDLTRVSLDLTEKERTRRGTFRRAIAQERPDLEFFSVGNDFFDSVCRSLHSDPTGRCYAVECRADHPVWRGFEFAYRIEVVPVQATARSSGHTNLLDHFVAERVEHCFVSEDGALSPIAGVLLKLRQSLEKRNKGRTWWNLTKDKGALLPEYYANWDKLVALAEEVAGRHVRNRFAQMLRPKLEAQTESIKEQIRKLRGAQPDGWESEVESLVDLRASLGSWDIVLDAAGFLSVNGGILGD